MPTFKNEVTGNDEHAVVGVSPNGRGVVGWSEKAYGVSGDSKNSAGVRGTSVDGRGTEGWSTNSEGVVGISKNSTGVWGQASAAGTGVAGNSKSGKGVYGVSESGPGVYARSQSGRGVEGWSDTNYGVSGDSRTFPGVRGTSVDGRGVEGWSTGGAGVFGISQRDIGVYGKGGRLAGLFEGDVEVTGDIRLTNADCAEDFDVADADLVEPGTVMVLGEDASLHPSQLAYDKRVAGVVSGAGDYKPGIVLDKQQAQSNRKPIALLGKVYCKVDASYAPIAIGDLLTTAPTPGHAMKASDPLQAFGAIIGKALRPLAEGQGLIPILVALQ